MTAIQRKFVDIYIVNADTDPSALASTDIVKGEITQYSKSGGEDDAETVHAFGGDISKDKPRSQIELSFEITPSMEEADRWDKLVYGLTNGVYVSNKSVGDKAIFIQAKNGSSFKTHAFNNCNSVNWDWQHEADDNRTGTFSFKLSPESRTGIANHMTAASGATSLPNWSTLIP